MTETVRTSKGVWAGRVLSAVVVLAMLADAATALLAPQVLAPSMEATGFPIELSTVLGIIILICTALYALPKTSVLGAILLTGFFGGAICTHLRIGEIGSPEQIICLLLGLMTWGGLYLRDPRLRALLPLAA